jgi:hypothetical protein
MVARRKKMAIEQQLLDILACPVCQGDIKLTVDEKGLKCVSCSRVYPIKEDIPVMLSDEATIEPERETKV